MAYLKEIIYKCGCGKRQAVALYSFRNEEEGRFCRTCGKRALARQQEIEREMFATGRTTGPAFSKVRLN